MAVLNSMAATPLDFDTPLPTDLIYLGGSSLAKGTIHVDGDTLLISGAVHSTGAYTAADSYAGTVGSEAYYLQLYM